jgi:hypothetical protein
MAGSDLFYRMKITVCYRKILLIEATYQLKRDKDIQIIEKENCPLSHLLYDSRTRWNLYGCVSKLIYILTEIMTQHQTVFSGYS